MTASVPPPVPSAAHQHALRQLADEARSRVEGCAAAALTLSTSPVVTVGTSLLGTQLDRVQWAHGQGPGVDAVHQLQVFNVADLASARSWPDFAQMARSRGIVSCLAVPITWQGRAMGAFTLYSAEPDGFAGQEALGLRMADAAARALATADAEQAPAAPVTAPARRQRAVS